MRRGCQTRMSREAQHETCVKVLQMRLPLKVNQVLLLKTVHRDLFHDQLLPQYTSRRADLLRHESVVLIDSHLTETLCRFQNKPLRLCLLRCQHVWYSMLNCRLVPSLQFSDACE